MCLTKDDIEESPEVILHGEQLDRYAKRVYPLFLRGLQKQLAPAIAFIRDYPAATPPLDALINPAVMREPIILAYQLVGVTAARREYYSLRREKSFIDFLIDKWKALFLEYATNYAYRIQNELAETTKEEIRQALKEAYEMQLSGNQIASYIYKKVGRKSTRERAVTIARTESATASNLGKQEGAKSWLNGQQGYKQWMGRIAHERQSHLEVNNEIIPIEQDFELNIYKDGILMGSEVANLPGDTRLSAANRINCRCSVRFLDERALRLVRSGLI